MARPRTTEHEHIYGEVNSPEDVRTINQKIRHDMDGVTKREQLTELKKRSDELNETAGKIDDVQRVAREEDRKTTSHANDIARRHGWDADYDPWGKG